MWTAANIKAEAKKNTDVSRGALTVPSPLFPAFGKKMEGQEEKAGSTEINKNGNLVEMISRNV